MNKLANWILSLSVIALLVGCMMRIPAAIDEDMAWREQIVQTRCAKHWIDGYCDGLKIAEARR